MLQRRQVPQPRSNGSVIEIFPNWEMAYCHIRDHLLSAWECLAWVVIEPGLKQHIQPDDYDERLRLSNEYLRTKGEAMQDVYDSYAKVISEDLKSAKRLGWVVTQEDTTAVFGLNGVYTVVRDNVFTTAFLPGWGTRATTRAGLRAERLDSNLPRDCVGSKIRNGEPRPPYVPAEKLSLEQKQYAVFLHCLKWVKGQQRKDFLKENLQSYLWLKRILPTWKRCTFAFWQEKRKP